MISLKSRSVMLVVALALTFVFTTTLVQAADYPSKPIRMIINQAAGGTGDIATRTLSKTMEKYLGTSIVVENITEAGGITGVNTVYGAAPDGYTLLSMFLPRTVQQEVLLHPAYKTTKMTPIYNFRRGVFVLVVGKNSPYKDFGALVEASKKRPLNVGVTGIGSATHLQTVRLAGVSGARFEIVPFKGGAPAKTAAIGGHVDAAVIPVDSALLSADELRILVTPTAERLPDAPDVPAVTEFGYDDAEVSFYQGILAPPNLPQNIRQKLEDAVASSLQDPDFKKQWTDLGLESYGLPGTKLMSVIETYYDVVDTYKDALK